jgi:hypothetical protein
MSQDPHTDRVTDTHEALTAELGYHWEPQRGPQAMLMHRPWKPDDAKEVIATIVEGFVDAEWRVAHLRELIQTLGMEPQGRTRLALTQQLIEGFLDEARIKAALARLSDETRTCYSLLLLVVRLQSLYVAPDSRALWKGFERGFARHRSTIVNAGLALESEDNELTLPRLTVRWLPEMAVPIAAAKEPDTFVPAGDAQQILGQIQQVLSMLETEPAALRPRLAWQAPPYPYAESIACWPPMPSDAQKLFNNLEHEQRVRLRPPEPYLDAATLARWSERMGISEHWTEFVYHLMVALGLLWTGTPVQRDSEAVKRWMTLTPGEQVAVLYAHLQDLVNWSSWWPHWQSGAIQVIREYYGYWSLMMLEESMSVTVTTLRGMLLELLSFLPQNAWIALEDLEARLSALFPTAEGQHYQRGLTMEDRTGSWVGFLHTVLYDLIAGPLHKLGLVDVGPSLDDVRFVRLRHLQDLHWQRRNTVPLEPAVTLSPDALRYLTDEATVELKSPVPTDLTTELLRWARPSGFSQNLVRYTLDVARLHSVFEQGDDPDTLAAAWTAAAGFEAPGQVLDWWQYWWSRYGHVRLYPAQALLQTRDELTMQELQVALPSLRRAILGQLTDSAALMDADEIDRILNDLARQGYTPKEIG